MRKAITINRPPEEVYGFWRNLENLPRFMAHLESVRECWTTGARTGRRKRPWARRSSGTAEIIEDRPNELISWRSTDDATVSNAGTVRFTQAPGGRGTEVHVELSYDPPAGAVGATIAKLLGEEPSQQVDGDLRRFKQVMETGEVVHSDASIHATATPGTTASRRCRTSLPGAPRGDSRPREAR